MVYPIEIVCVFKIKRLKRLLGTVYEDVDEKVSTQKGNQGMAQG